MDELRNTIRTIPDFPQPGILFRDITTMLQDPAALGLSIDAVAAKLEGVEFDLVLGPESRGFIFGVPVAYKLKKGFVPVRKAGKLPSAVISKSYDLEYGSSVIEIHADAIKPGQKVAVIDDLLATGGTCKALAELVEDAGGEIAAMVFLIELEALGGREVLKGYDVRSILKY
ncbi:MAG: adenine phosphoribosyltransferase [Clostridiales bacterium]|jgi:adenine phosphoribosyltransferase|nr:adenine phosphoribosyltransferase [Clostridiales bacterium]